MLPISPVIQIWWHLSELLLMPVWLFLTRLFDSDLTGEFLQCDLSGHPVNHQNAFFLVGTLLVTTETKKRDTP